MRRAVRPNRYAPEKPADAQLPKKLDTSRLVFHSDQGATDLIALLSLTKAKSGGESKWVSGLAIHNELLRRGRKVRVQGWEVEVPNSTCMHVA